MTERFLRALLGARPGIKISRLQGAERSLAEEDRAYQEQNRDHVRKMHKFSQRITDFLLNAMRLNPMDAETASHRERLHALSLEELTQLIAQSGEGDAAENLWAASPSYFLALAIEYQGRYAAILQLFLEERYG